MLKMELKSEVVNTPQEEKQQQQESFHVLAVDDSLMDRKLLERLLTVSSYQVTCVDSGNKALEYLGLIDNLENNSSPSKKEGSRVNLIMTDYCMPGMTGYDLLKRLKGSSWKDVPVVVMSSENVPSRVSMCLEGGAEEFLLKPVRLSDLEKLQPHILKSPNLSCANDGGGGGADGENDDNNNNDNKNEISNYKSNSSSGFSKRKAMSAEANERRPKIKEVAVV